MTNQANAVMQAVHGADIYAGFVPTFASDMQGWNSTSPVFAEFIERDRMSVVVDVGVWKGASTVHLAEIMKRSEIGGVVIAVDTFLGSPEHCMPGQRFFDLIPRRHGVPLLYEQFLANIVRAGVAEYVVPLPQTTGNAAIMLQWLHIHPNLVHVDAAHEYEAVLADARAYWKILAPGGALIGDDYHSSWPGVVRGADEFAAEVGQKIEVREPKWILRKPT
jgi:hypothetical protein